MLPRLGPDNTAEEGEHEDEHEGEHDFGFIGFSTNTISEVSNCSAVLDVVDDGQALLELAVGHRD